MKYYSEVLGKSFNTEKECLDAEASFAIKNNATKSAARQEKKASADKVEQANIKLKQANEAYKVAQNKAAEILEKSNKEVREILDKAKDVVRQAEKERLDAIKDFNKKYGAYTTTLTGEEAEQEFNRVLDKFRKTFNPFDWIDLLF